MSIEESFRSRMSRSDSDGPLDKRSRQGVRKRLVLVGGLVALAGVALFRVGDGDPKAPDEDSHGASYTPSAPELDHPTLQAEELRAAGIPPGSVRRIEQHLISLNAALARLSAVHQDYHAAGSDGEREAIQARARPLHLAVDRAEDAIHAELTGQELVRFHDYLWPRIAAAGLPSEAEHHEQGGIRSGVVRGFDHPAEVAQ